MSAQGQVVTTRNLQASLSVMQPVQIGDLTLDKQTIKAHICQKATDSEIAMFLQICKVQKLNPFLREVYMVKYKDDMPASIVTGKETFLKRAMRNPKYRGHKAWTDGKVPEMTATAEVYVEGYQVPITVTVDYDEYVATKKDYKTGKEAPNKMWASKPKTMLKKVALCQALREAFPEDFGGLYSQEEINTIDSEKLPTAPIDVQKPTQCAKEDNIIELKKAETVVDEGSPHEDVSDEDYKEWADQQTEIEPLANRFNGLEDKNSAQAKYIKGKIDILAQQKSAQKMQ